MEYSKDKRRHTKAPPPPFFPPPPLCLFPITATLQSPSSSQGVYLPPPLALLSTCKLSDIRKRAIHELSSCLLSERFCTLSPVQGKHIFLFSNTFSLPFPGFIRHLLLQTVTRHTQEPVTDARTEKTHTKRDSRWPCSHPHPCLKQRFSISFAGCTISWEVEKHSHYWYSAN